MAKTGKTVRLSSRSVSIKQFNKLLIRVGQQIKALNNKSVSKVYSKMPRYIKVVSFYTKMPSGKTWKLVISYTLSSDDSFTYEISGSCLSTFIQQGKNTKKMETVEWEGVGKAIGA